MKYLVDANVLSEATKTRPSRRVIAWLNQHERDLVIDPIVLGEIRFGILLLPRGKRRTRLMRWFNDGIQRIVCLPWDATAALHWAELLAKLRANGTAMPIKDSLIAATAIANQLVVASRNLRDFEPAGIAVENPFDS